MQRFLKVTLIIILILFGVFAIWHFQHLLPNTQAQSIASQFKGQILVASDADMLATAYADGILNKVAGVEDSLSLITIQNGNPYLISQQHVSNSVISWPAIIAWHPQKKYAYVAETRGIYLDSKMKLEDVYKDMPIGQKITVVDYTDPQSPQIIQEKIIGENIQGVSINAQGNFLVAGSTEKGKELVIAKLEDGLIKEVFYFTHQGIQAKAENNSGFRTIEFHPKENFIASNLNNTHILFHKIYEEEGEVKVQQVGQSQKVAKHWSVGNWHPSGQFFILSDVAWGQGSTGFIFNGRGKLVSVRFNPQGEHQIASQVKVGLSPEGFDISPDGQYAIVVNMRRTYLPKKIWFVPGRGEASLSLIKINAQNGELSRLGKQYAFEGALPEDAVFDEESNSIAVAIYQEQFAEFPKQGWISFWEIEQDRLVQTDQKISLTRGPHSLKLID